MIPLGIIDQSPIRSGGNAADAVRETVALAGLADRLGYRRYWLAEHHSSNAFAGAAPEILIGHVAQATRSIRVGSGGVMLSHCAPLKVAEVFRMLETLHPGRIDLGIGRAPGADQLTSIALQPGPKAYGLEVFPDQVADLVAYLDYALPAEHPLKPVHAMPTGPGLPEIWLLGSGGDSAYLAAQAGLPFAHAHFINPEGGERMAEIYRRRFQPSPGCPRPYLMVGVFALVAETEEEARHHALSRDLWVAHLMTGRNIPFPSPEEALAYRYAPHEQAIVDAARQRGVVGTPSQVRARLTDLAAAYGADELAIVTITHDPAARRRSYELLAEAFALPAQAA